MLNPDPPDPVTVTPLDGGALWRVVIGGSKGNVIDAAVTGALTAVFAEAARAPGLKALLLEGQGRHFSFGASVPEHLPGQVEGMLRRFHGMLLALLDSHVSVLAVVRGQCLGGGLELVTLCQRVFAAPDARLGQPEIALGVFAPAASLVLAERVGRRHAEDLCLSGRTLGADEARAMGLVDEIADDPAEAALAYARRHLLPRSASSLRFAVRAVRAGLRARLAVELPALERLYLDELMATHDAVEGLQAFLDKRAPDWRDA
jgi:cyclohexa-1,5-dienecarbonyl-CoA hydratase